MKPDDFTKLITAAGGSLDKRWLVLIVVVVPIVGAAIVWMRKRQAAGATKKEAALASPTAATAPNPAAGGEAPALGAAWKAFVRDLPSTYRRSILNFEHYVVLGDAAHGKTQVIDHYSDWHRLAKQFIPSKPDNPDLPLYIGSRTVTMEIPAKVLRMQGQACKQALTTLWKPLYQHKTPVVVVVVNAYKLIEGHVDEVRDLAETIRAKINLLASIHGKALEIRLVLSHLDLLIGYTDVAMFCRSNGIMLRLGLGGSAAVEDALSGWFEAIRVQLPRALTTVDTAGYGRMLRFVQEANRLLKPVRHFCTGLFAHDASSPDPVRGDLFFASQPIGLANPLTYGDSRPGPDPRLPHRITAAVAAGAGLALLGGAFTHQEGQWSEAHSALDRYRPHHVVRETEHDDRAKIMAFTQEHTSFFDTFPDFFATPRMAMREGFSSKVRNDLLIPRLREVVRTGKATADQIPLTHTRSLYFLGLIHSDKFDSLALLDQHGDAQNTRLDLWSSMTGIESTLIADYLKNTDVPNRIPLDLGLMRYPVDEYDTEKPWREFIDKVFEAMYGGESGDYSARRNVDPLVTAEELDTLQHTAADLVPNVVRLENAAITLQILPALARGGRVDAKESAASEDTSVADPDKRADDGLAQAYNESYKEYTQQYSAFRGLDVSELRGMLDVVRDTGLAVDDARGLLGNFVLRLDALYRRHAPAEDNGHLIALGPDAIYFDELEWIDGIRNSKVRILIDSFVQNSGDRDIFFNERNEPDPTVWNPAGRAAAVFEGRVALDGRYSREAYESNVRRPVLALSNLLDSSKLPEQDRKNLSEFVRKSVDRYGHNFRLNMVAFIKGFDLNVTTAEELRVALTQMSADTGGTSFDEFLNIVDKNTRLNVQNAETHATEPMLAPAAEAMTEFDAWHGVVSGDKGAPKIVEYKKILQQLLIDLGGSLGSMPTAQDAILGARSAGADAETKRAALETELTPSGRVFLGSIVETKGAYWGLVRNWLAGTNLPQEQQWPFALPLGRIEATGRRDVETTVARALERDMMQDLVRVVNRFPFDKNAREDVTPKELTNLFHPKEGRVLDYFRRYLEPLSDMDGPGGFRPKSSLSGVHVSKSIYDFINAAAYLSARLWDNEGQPRPLEYQLVTVPFGKTINEDTALTLAYLNLAEGSLFNFNQRQSGKVLYMDWTKTTSSQVGVQLTNLETKENSFPDPLNRPGSYFSFLHLLMAAQQPPEAVKEPPTAQLYSWDFSIGTTEKIRVQFVLKNDPWATFNLRPYVLRMANR